MQFKIHFSFQENARLDANVKSGRDWSSITLRLLWTILIMLVLSVNQLLACPALRLGAKAACARSTTLSSLQVVFQQNTSGSRDAYRLQSRLETKRLILRNITITTSFPRFFSSLLGKANFLFTVTEIECNFKDEFKKRWLLLQYIAGFHCHAIKIKIENHSMNEVKKFTRYRR